MDKSGWRGDVPRPSAAAQAAQRPMARAARQIDDDEMPRGQRAPPAAPACGHRSAARASIRPGRSCARRGAAAVSAWTRASASGVPPPPPTRSQALAAGDARARPGGSNSSTPCPPKRSRPRVAGARCLLDHEGGVALGQRQSAALAHGARGVEHDQCRRRRAAPSAGWRNARALQRRGPLGHHGGQPGNGGPRWPGTRMRRRRQQWLERAGVEATASLQARRGRRLRWPRLFLRPPSDRAARGHAFGLGRQRTPVAHGGTVGGWCGTAGGCRRRLPHVGFRFWRRAAPALHPSMGQCQFRHRIDIVRRDFGAALECSERTRRSQHHQVGPHAVHASRERAFRGALQHGIRPRQARQPGAGCNHRRSQAGLFTGMCFGHPKRVFVEAQTRAHDRHPLPGFARVGQRHRQAETIQQLRAQFALLGFMVPTSTKRAACCCEMPSRSTVFTPLAATSSKASTSASGSRLTSSTYSTPLWARASRPGARRTLPSRSTSSTSSVPTSAPGWRPAAR
jgi:hypothetical protein